MKFIHTTLNKREIFMSQHMRRVTVVQTSTIDYLAAVVAVLLLPQSVHAIRDS